MWIFESQPFRVRKVPGLSKAISMKFGKEKIVKKARTGRIFERKKKNEHQLLVVGGTLTGKATKNGNLPFLLEVPGSIP